MSSSITQCPASMHRAQPSHGEMRLPARDTYSVSVPSTDAAPRSAACTSVCVASRRGLPDTPSTAMPMPLLIECRHTGLVVSVARDRGHLGVDAGEVRRRELYVDGGRVLLEVRAALRPRDRDDVVALGQHPGDCELCRRHTLLVGDLLHLVREPLVRGQVLAGEARGPAAEVVLVELLG